MQPDVLRWPRRLVRCAVLVAAALPPHSLMADDLDRRPPPPESIAAFAFDANRPVTHVVVRGDGVAGSGGDGEISEGGRTAASTRPVYDNWLGATAFSFGAGVRVADDLRTLAADFCPLDRFEFLVTGDADGFGTGPFAVDYALLWDCPGAGGFEISRTAGRVELPDEGVYRIEVRIPDDLEVLIPSDVWLSVRMSRAHAGWIGGAPALVGQSDDAFAHQFFGCGLWLGPYPDGPHASFNAGVFVREPCDPTFLGFRASAPPHRTFQPGAGVRVAEDIALVPDSCDLLGYEVAVRGAGDYVFDLRAPAATGEGPGDVIPGTAGSLVGADNGLQVAQVFPASPVTVASPLWLTARGSTDSARIVLANRPSEVGRSAPTIAVETPEGWTIAPPPNQPEGATMHISVRCRGEAPLGACCDMHFTDENGDAVCRDVPEPNCPFPRWLRDVACASEPFFPRCGLSACCMADGGCENRTERRCPFGGGEWRRGTFCDDLETDCPEVCVVSEASCHFAHPGGGCVDVPCCAAVCARDSFCCDDRWDAECAAAASSICGFAPSNDRCAPEGAAEGARAVLLPVNVETDARRATFSDDDRSFCCHIGFDPVCVDGCDPGTRCDVDADCLGGPEPVCNENGACEGGCDDGAECVEDVDCPVNPDGWCPSRQPAPGAAVFGSVWYRFDVPGGVGASAAIEVATCGSNAPAKDSLIQVFAVADSDKGVCADLGRCVDGSYCDIAAQNCADGRECVETMAGCSRSRQDCPAGVACELDGLAACDGLRPVACNDDAADGCGDPTQARNSAVCLPALPRGDTFYVLVAAKTPETVGAYRLTMREVAGCSPDASPAPNDFCSEALPLSDGATAYDLSDATLDCPVDGCMRGATRTAWFDYVAPSDGHVVFSVCGDDPELHAFEGCDCASVEGDPHAESLCCLEPAGSSCATEGRCTIDVTAGACYKLRLGRRNGGDSRGELTVASSPEPRCPDGPITWIDPPNGVIDARSPVALHDVAPGATDALHMIAPPGASTACWSLCETSSPISPNAITRVTTTPDGASTVVLARPITSGAATTVAYARFAADAEPGVFIAHPGNVNGDEWASADDVRRLVDVLLNRASSPWGVFSEDVDRSGHAAPADVLALIDLLNGAESTVAWIGTPRPTALGVCPD